MFQAHESSQGGTVYELAVSNEWTFSDTFSLVDFSLPPFNSRNRQKTMESAA